MSDQSNDAEIAADEAESRLYQQGLAAMQAESADAGDETPYEAEFREFIAGLGLRHFAYREFLFLGGSHHAPGSCHGLNALPPKSLWTNLSATARVLDELRHRLGASVRLNSIYRNQAYNSCLSGAAAESQHKSMRAADFTAADGNGPQHWRSVLLKMRNDEGLFKGGIGLYNTFVHVDTRGHNADW
jgi:hypothetical protein